MPLSAEVLPRTQLNRTQHHQMYELMQRYYDGVNRETFETDLAEKQWVIILREPATDVIRGFSTQRLIDVDVRGRTVRVLFSGDTIVDRRYWADNPLARTWGRFTWSLIRQSRDAPLYWFLIAKGYKTYRFLPVFFREFYPRVDTATPFWACELLDALGRAKFPDTYDVQRRIVRASERSGCLRRGVADIDERRLADVHVRFFQEANPGHANGDELCCLAPLVHENFSAAARRVIGIEDNVTIGT